MRVRHLAAGFGAAAAHLSAAAHFRVGVGHLLAVVGAALADFSTHAARQRMQFRTADHEIGAGAADLGAIGEQPNVIPLRMPATLSQAMLDRGDADRVTGRTVFDALLHFALIHHVLQGWGAML
jgi:hypothetical protein